MNGIFLIEILMTIFTAYVDDYGVVIDDVSIIFKGYAKTWLLLDIVSIFPFEFLNSNLGGLNVAGKILRVLKLSKIYKMISNLKRL